MAGIAAVACAPVRLRASRCGPASRGSGLIVIAKANAGLPAWHEGHRHHLGTPDYARLAADAGARVIGDCCGTSPAHLAAMQRALRGHPSRPAPSRAMIDARLNPPVALPGEDPN